MDIKKLGTTGVGAGIAVVSLIGCVAPPASPPTNLLPGEASTTAVCGHLKSGQRFATQGAVDAGWDCYPGLPTVVIQYNCGVALLGLNYVQPAGDCVGFVPATGGRAIIGTFAMSNGGTITVVLGP